MSNISTAYDAIQTRLVALLPSHARLTNPYQIDQNMERSLNKAYGVQVTI